MWICHHVHPLTNYERNFDMLSDLDHFGGNTAFVMVVRDL